MKVYGDKTDLQVLSIEMVGRRLTGWTQEPSDTRILTYPLSPGGLTQAAKSNEMFQRPVLSKRRPQLGGLPPDTRIEGGVSEQSAQSVFLTYGGQSLRDAIETVRGDTFVKLEG